MRSSMRGYSGAIISSASKVVSLHAVPAVGLSPMKIKAYSKDSPSRRGGQEHYGQGWNQIPPEIVTPAEDSKVAARTLRHQVDSAGTSGKKEGVIDTVAGLPALRFRHVVFKVCFSQVL
jgi:hypothetical protein